MSDKDVPMNCSANARNVMTTVASYSLQVVYLKHLVSLKKKMSGR